jgi:penicillin-binding protein 1C
MQVARLLDPHPRTFGGKIRQLWRAMQLEWHLSKRDILTLYLNRAPFGGTLQGVGGKLDLSRQTAVAAQLFRSGAAGGFAAGTSRLRPTAGRNVPKRRAIKCSTAW